MRAATANGLDLTSQMVRLRAETTWEKAIVPAFVYFFGQLYPFGRVNGAGRTAAAAGGCMLVRRTALRDAGGLVQIRDALIDDVALAKLLKRRPGGRLWLGHNDEITSERPYPRVADLWRMVARSAYTQLRYSPVLLAGAVAGLTLVYLVPPAAVLLGVVRRDRVVAALGTSAWAIMAATYAPMLRAYRIPQGWAVGLPGVAALYTAMTLDSTRLGATSRARPRRYVEGPGRRTVRRASALSRTHRVDLRSASPASPRSEYCRR